MANQLSRMNQVRAAAKSAIARSKAKQTQIVANQNVVKAKRKMN